MKTVELGHEPVDLISLLTQAREGDLLLRLEDGSEFLVLALDAFDREILQTRANQELMKLLEERAKSPARYTLAEVKQRLGIVDQPGQTQT